MNPPAIDAAIDLLDDLLSPEAYGHALPQDAKTRAYVVRDMLLRLQRRQKALMEIPKCED
jgi:hypothetical protein